MSGRFGELQRDTRKPFPLPTKPTCAGRPILDAGGEKIRRFNLKSKNGLSHSG